MGYTAHAFAELDMTKRQTLSLSQRETEAQRGHATCPRWHSWEVAGPGLSSGLPDSNIYTLHPGLSCPSELRPQTCVLWSGY